MDILQPLLQALFDYAGLFPPAGQSMEQAVRDYRDVRRGAQRWMLARFVVPVSRLEELQAAWTRIAASAGESAAGEVLPVSVLAGDDPFESIAQADQFGRRAEQPAAVRIESVEVRWPGAQRLPGIRQAVPQACPVYVELPAEAVASDALGGMLDAIGSAKCFAKLRTGGMSADAFPSAATLTRAVSQLARRRLAWKATAGLHHPLRSPHRVSAQTDAETVTMHGFLNLLLVVALLQQDPQQLKLAEQLLTSSQADQLTVTDDDLRWQDVRWSAEVLRRARQVMHSIGSCSFHEPVEDLLALGWLPAVISRSHR